MNPSHRSEKSYADKFDCHFTIIAIVLAHHRLLLISSKELWTLWNIQFNLTSFHMSNGLQWSIIFHVIYNYWLIWHVYNLKIALTIHYFKPGSELCTATESEILILAQHFLENPMVKFDPKCYILQRIAWSISVA